MPDEARPPVLSPELVAFFEGDVFAYVATRDRHLRPTLAVLSALRAHDDHGGLTILVPEVDAAATVANVRDNALAAVVATRASTVRSVQVKGHVVEVRPARDEERALHDRHRACMGEQFDVLGVPACFRRRFFPWPSVALELRVSDVFAQTPGPGAGRRLVSP